MNRQLQARAHLLDTVTDIIRVIDGGWIAAKQRDRREPGLAEKERNQARLALIIRRMFNRQREHIREQLETLNPERKAVLPPIEMLLEPDNELAARLLAALIAAARDGVTLFGSRSPLQIDWSRTNSRAARWAREYVYDLINDINATTLETLQDVLSRFVETPGMTIGDVIAELPFDPVRAERIAITEITRVYATANQLAGEDLRDEFGDVRVVKQWFTNADSLVCPLCGPLDGKEVGINDTFYPPQSRYANGDPPRHVNCRCWTETTTALAELEND